jgi:benzoate/toluate 1,2-dioxygenase beta subunit
LRWIKAIAQSGSRGTVGRGSGFRIAREPRTSHNISNVEILEQVGGLVKLRFNWTTQSFRYKTTDTYFGTSFYTLDTIGDQPLIRSKKVVLKNDYIHHVIDVYHV